MNSDIAVIIPTLNSSRTIARCLESIRNQTSRCSEVLVVDRFSKDGSPSIAESLGATVIQAKANRSLARNIGLESSTAKTVLFVDSDMILSPDVAREISECLAENDAAVIPEVSIGSGFWAKCKNLERQANSANPLFDAARCFRRSVLISIGKYDPKLEYGEDLDLQNRAIAHGLRIGRIKTIILHDEGDLSLESIIRKKYLYGKTLGGYLERNRRSALRQMNPLKGIVSPSLKVFKSTPRYGIGILIMKSFEWAAAGLGHLVHKRGHSASGIS